jgi:transglutaminase-like putative cysteine protease
MVESPVPSYWRLTSLDTFTGQDWISTNSYRSFSSQLPGIQAVPAATRVIQEQFQVQGLGSVWLPDAFTPVAVSGVRHVSYDPVSGSLITSHPTSNGLDYTVDSYQFLSDLSPAQLRSAPLVPTTGALHRYVDLPKSVPENVRALARSITAGQTTEYGEALALQNFFLGPAFTYSLSPPDDGYGISALTTFLFNTRTGYCQQFAGAFAVLARAIGLPTRLAVGFATGTDEGNGYFQVLNADAHTWPEVYFGPKYGWLPFEPTKSYIDPISAGYAPPSGPAGINGSSTPNALPSPIPKGFALPPGLIGGGNTGPTTSLSGNQGGGSGGSHHHNPVWPALLVLVLVLIAWSCVVAIMRRSRWLARRWRARHDPGAVVRSHWADVTERLSWWDAKPTPGETDEEFADRAGRLLARQLRDPSPWLPGGVRRLAHLATEATFASAVPKARADEAAVVAREIHQGLFRSATARQLLMWALVPWPGLGSEARGRTGSSEPAPNGAAARRPWPVKPAGASGLS